MYTYIYIYKIVACCLGIDGLLLEGSWFRGFSMHLARRASLAVWLRGGNYASIGMTVFSV